nr:PAS domain S-box protein [Deltaproteobacteria bacterium]
MNDSAKSKKQLIAELQLFRQRVARLEAETFLHAIQEPAAAQTEVTAGWYDQPAQQRSECNARAVRNSELSVCYFDGVTGTFVVSPQIMLLHGLSPEAPLDLTNAMALIHPEDRARVEAAWQSCIKEGSSCLVEYRIVREDGTVRWLATRAQHLTGLPGPKIVALCQDITEQKRTERMLQKSEERFHIFKDSSPAIAWVKDAQGRHLYINKTYENRFGVKAQDVLGKTDFDFWPQETARIFQEHDRAVLISNRAIEIEEKAPAADGGISSWLNVKFPFRNTSGKLCIGGIGIDITERKRMEESLRESEQHFRAIYELAPLGIALVDSYTGQFLQVNPRYEQILSRTQVEMLTLDFQSITHPDDLPEDLEKMQVLRQGKIRFFKREKRYLLPDGSHIWVNLTVVPMWKEGETPTCHITMIEDITERKRTEEELSRAKSELERRVSERTRDLASANKLLKQEIEERRVAAQALRTREQQLKQKTKSLEELNAALKVLLKRREEDKRELEEKVLLNVKELLDPFLHQLGKSGLNEHQSVLLAVLESNLKDIVSPFAQRLSSAYLRLTPVEIQVASLVKEGKDTKSIAAMMNVSPETITSHRKNIRAKLGVKNQKTNLRTLLLSLER